MNTATTANDATAEEALKAADKAKRQERLHTRINKASKYLNVAGPGWRSESVV